jgi:uncharacterized protein YndB with AHSA1/START domain
VSQTDAVRVTTVVAVDPERAFQLFTEEVDAWWRRGPRHRFDATRTGVMRFEPGVGGRLLEVYDDAAFDAYEVGRVLVWKPAERLVFEWRGTTFAPGEKTEVEVRFERTAGGTRVLLEHRGWDGLRRDHPARHGLEGGAFTSMIGLWWGDLLTLLRAHANRVRDVGEGDGR